jgi:hypothetical protein
VNKYDAKVNELDWDALKEDALRPENTYFDESSAKYIGCSFLGSVMVLTPSGKFYTPWACSNVTEDEAHEDEDYWEALERIAADHDGWIESGEGDPTDIFFCLDAEKERP